MTDNPHVALLRAAGAVIIGKTNPRELKTSHQAWKEQLSELRPESDPSQITSEAMEMAIRELEDRLPPVSPPENNEPLSLDGAMAFIRRHTSRG